MITSLCVVVCERERCRNCERVLQIMGYDFERYIRPVKLTKQYVERSKMV